MSVITKITGLAITAVAFAGMAFGQANLNCQPGTNTPANPAGPTAVTINPQIPIELRSEGATELVSDELVACNPAPAGSTSGQVTATLSATGIQGVTSRTGEATLTITYPGTTAYYTGTVSGTTITFGTAAAPVLFPTAAQSAGGFQMTVQNVRVNVTGQWPNNLQPVTETVQIVAQGNGLAAVTNIAAQTVGNIRNSLQVTGAAGTTLIAPGSNSAGTAASVAQFLVCSGSGAQAFQFTISSLFAGAFKTKIQNNTGATTPAIYANALIPSSESGTLLPSGTANFGTRFKIVFTNIPTNAVVNVPLSVNNGNFTIVLQSSAETAASVAAAAAGAALTNNAGTSTAIYEVTTTDVTATGSFLISPTVTYQANSVVANSTPISVAVSYAPSPALSVANGGTLPATLPTVPYFANTATPMNGSTFAACQTTLLFPFVTNQLGFETGLVIANAGKDNLGAANATVATGQSGACTFQFYGSTGAEGGTAPATVLAANFPKSTATPATIAPGATHADTLSNIAGGPFQGYAIATCPFLYGKGFAYIAYGLLQTNGVSMGYTANLISNTRTSFATSGIAVSNAAPEASGQ